MVYVIIILVLLIALGAAFYYEITHSYDDDKFVVICLKISTFVVSTTTLCLSNNAG